jgi:hypothetical protein
LQVHPAVINQAASVTCEPQQKQQQQQQQGEARAHHVRVKYSTIGKLLLCATAYFSIKRLLLFLGFGSAANYCTKVPVLNPCECC